MTKFFFPLIILFCVFHSSSGFSQTLSAGATGYQMMCENQFNYITSTPQLAGAACVKAINLQMSAEYPISDWTSLGTCSLGLCPLLYTSDAVNYFVGLGINTMTVGSEYIPVPYENVTVPAGVSCSSGVYDDTALACVGGTAAPSCISGTSQALVFLDCAAAQVVGTGADADCSSSLPVPMLASYNSCEYKLASVLDCYHTSTSASIFCDYNYVSTGYAAVSSDVASDTTASDSPSSGCPSTGCVNVSTPTGDGSDGSTGGTATVSCGATGQPTCDNGVKSGTTACGGTGQVSCTAGSGSGSGSGGAVCGAPPLPACAVDDTTGDSSLSNMLNFFTGTSPATPDPVPNTVSDLNNAGLNGGITFSTLTSWSLPAHTSTCPSGTFQAFGNTFTIDGGCSFASTYLGVFRAVMILFFTVGALFIVLKA